MVPPMMASVTGFPERSAALPDPAATGDNADSMAVDATSEASAIFRKVGAMRQYDPIEMAGP